MRPNYQAMDQILVRTSTLPCEFWSETDLNRCAQNEQIRTAIAIASPSLFGRLLQGDNSRKTQTALRKFVSRMSSRSTPFGMFAGVDSACFGDITSLTRSNRLITSTRPDMSLLIPIVVNLERIQRVRERLIIYPNPEIVVRAGQVWLERPATPISEQKEGAAVIASAAVLRTIALCSGGRSFEQVCRLLSSELNDPIERALELVHGLFDQRILISELRFAPSEWRTVKQTLEKLADIEEAKILVQGLRELFKAIEKWDLIEDKQASNYTEVWNTASALAPSHAKDLLQVDTKACLAQSTISRLVADELSRAADALLKLGGNKFDKSLARFKNSFINRYQMNREVALLELLSPRFGLGSPYSPNSFEVDRVREKRLLMLATDAIHRGLNQVSLTDDMLASLALWKPNEEEDERPISMDLFCSIVANSRNAIDQGDFQLLIGPRTGEIGGGKTLGRFAELIGELAIKQLQQLASIEQEKSEELIVEASCWTAYPRLTNLTITPSLRTHSVGAQCAPLRSNASVPVSEISIGFDNMEEKFYARWTRTGQKISVRAQHMLNRSMLPEAIRFLVDISLDGQPKLSGFDWGIAWNLMFLPRLVYGKSILSPACWNATTLAHNCQKKKSAPEWADEIQAWRTQWHVPAKIIISEDYYSDNGLLVDLDRPVDFDIFLNVLKNKFSSRLVAYEYIPYNTWHTTSEGTFATEIVATLVRSDDDPVPKRVTLPINQVVSAHDYMRLPGSDWIYLRVECGSHMQEQLIKDIHSTAGALLADNLIDRWFFVRYSDPVDHLRLRFRVKQRDTYRVLAILCKWATGFVERGLCHKFSIESYDREIERYGGVMGIDLAEDFFTVDSEIIAKILSHPDIDKVDRLILGAVTIRNILRAFDLADADIAHWLEYTVRYYDQKEISRTYRQNKILLQGVLAGDSKDPEVSKYLEIAEPALAEYERLRVLADKFKRLRHFERLGTTISKVRNHLTHMHSIRLFGLVPGREYVTRGILAKSLDSIEKQRQRKLA